MKSFKSQVSRLILCLAVISSFISCKHDLLIDDSMQSVTLTPQQTKNFLTIEQAKAYYKSQIEMLKREPVKVRNNANTDATFDGLDVVPEWNNARVINRNSISFVEVPYAFNNGKKLASSLSSDSTSNPTQRSAACLLVSANSQGAMTSSFMSVTADNDFLVNNGTLSNFTYNGVPNQFKGIEMHYDIRGSFINGWHFKQGRIDGRVQRNRSNATFRDCYRVDACLEWSYYVQMGGYTGQRTTVRDCSYSIMIGFCGGWFDYEYYSNYGGTGNNGWGGNVTSEWGASCDETCQEAAAVQNIVDHLTHECLQYPLNELKNNAMVHTLTAFNGGNIPNITLLFQEGTVSGAQAITHSSSNGRNHTITLDYAKLASATDLFIATTIVHESIHAYIQMYLTVIHPEWYTEYRLRNNLPPGSEDFETLFKAYAEGKNPNDADHLQMSATYRSYIRDCLMSYGGDSSREFADICSDLAWAGLNYSHLPRSDRDRITNRINAELQNLTFGRQIPRGTNTCR
jgi:hypothetical protein